MTTMRFNHMELTFPKGTLDAAFRKDVGRFYGEIFGWSSMDIDLLHQSCLYLQVDSGQFLLLAESDKPISATVNFIKCFVQSAISRKFSGNHLITSNYANSPGKR